MRLRLIVRSVSKGAAANIGGPVETEHRTFDVEATKEVEDYLLEPIHMNDHWTSREIIGVEVIK